MDGNVVLGIALAVAAILIFVFTVNIEIPGEPPDDWENDLDELE